MLCTKSDLSSVAACLNDSTLLIQRRRMELKQDDSKNGSSEAGNPILNGLVHGLGVLPQNLISFALGSVVRAPLPETISRPLNKAFVRIFDINMAEAELPMRSYKTIEDVFTRKLQPGSRKINGQFISPADGILEKSEPAIQGGAVQAKGISYSLAELVFGKKDSPEPDFKPAWFVTVYLAPHNYHRVHSPFAGRVTNLRYIPGRLWPVNKPAVRTVPGLFCRNERLVFDFELAQGGKAHVVMVGAMNVGRMVTPLKPDFVTNAAARQVSGGRATELPLEADAGIRECGQELGTFMLGSTVIVVLDEKATASLAPKQVKAPHGARMGQSLSV